MKDDGSGGDDSMGLLGAFVAGSVPLPLPRSTVSRDALRAYAEAHGIGAERLLIPADGETMRF